MGRTNRFVRRIFFLTLIILLGFLVIVDQWSRNRYGASLHQMAGRYLPKEIAWQREQRPSLIPVLFILEKLIPSDNRYNFAPTGNIPAISSGNWVTKIVGPHWKNNSLSVNYKTHSEGERSHLLANRREFIVDSSSEFKRVISKVSKGDIITLLPGTYSFSGNSITLSQSGESSFPITVRSRRLGDARLEFDLVEGFHVLAPYWVFENLEIVGVCQSHSKCEHAFHIVGRGESIIIRNLLVKNFNAHIKVNGNKNKDFPDSGLIEYSMFINDEPRITSNPVTLIDVVGANDWIVRKSVIADFAKGKGDRISYGGFFKGGGENNLFEQNLVICEMRHKGGVRLGLSFGNGGTGEIYSRNGANKIEHFGGILRRNVIANCPNDVGIYLNKSTGTMVAKNLLLNTQGIHVRYKESDAIIWGNAMNGSIVDRDGGRHNSINNESIPYESFQYPESLNDELILKMLTDDIEKK